MKRVEPVITDEKKLLGQIRKGAEKYANSGLPSLKNGGSKRNIVDIEFGDRIQNSAIDEATIRARRQSYINNNPEIRRHVDVFMIHAELGGTNYDMVIEV